MSLIILISSIVLTILITLMVWFVAPRKARKMVVAFVMSIGLMLVALVCAYTFDLEFRYGIDMLFNAKTQHEYIIKSVTYAIPLPSKTILAYRTSETQAKYITKISKDDIIKFYSQIDGVISSESISQEKDSASLMFLHNQNVVTIHIKQASTIGNREILIDVKEQ